MALIPWILMKNMRMTHWTLIISAAAATAAVSTQATSEDPSEAPRGERMAPMAATATIMEPSGQEQRPIVSAGKCWCTSSPL